MLNGYTAATPGNLLVGAGILFVGTNKIGISRGGFTFDPGMAMRNVEFDNKSSDVAGLDFVQSYASKMSGTLLEVSKANLSLFEHGQQWSGGDPDVLTPLPTLALVPTGGYLVDVRLILDTGNGTFHRIYMPFAIGKYTLKSVSQQECEIAVEIMGRVPLNGFTNAPYQHEKASFLPGGTPVAGASV